MEETKTKYILVALVVIVIVAASVGLYLIKDAGVEGITAMEGKAQADEIANNWNTSAKCVGLGAGEIIAKNGYASSWQYQYQNDMSGNGTYKLRVWIYSNGTNQTEVIWLNPPSFANSITNWTLDSNSVIDIATQNPEINTFLKHNPRIDILSLKGGVENPVWSIYWTYNIPIDDPHWAEISIDANTGEVLYVEADN